MPYVLKTGGKGLWARTVTKNILSYANLLHCCFKVKLEAGRPGDPEYCGYIANQLKASQTGECVNQKACKGVGEQETPASQPTSLRQEVITAKEYQRWTAGSQIQLNAEIAMLNDKQLGKALAYHRFVIRPPDRWYWDKETQKHRPIAAIACNHYNNKGSHFLNFEILEPADRAGEIWQLHITYPKRACTRVDLEGQDEERFDVCRLLNQVHNYPKTLEDLGITLTAVQRANQMLLNLWSCAPLSATPMVIPEPASTNGGVPQTDTDGPFLEPELNEAWRVLASQMQEGYE
eukprot:3284575-Rhodomonas_salina.1